MTQIIILFHVKSPFCDLHDVNVKTTVDLLLEDPQAELSFKLSHFCSGT